MEIMPGIYENVTNKDNDSNKYENNAIGTESFSINLLNKDELLSSKIGVETFDLTTGIHNIQNNNQPQIISKNQLVPIIIRMPKNPIINFYLNATTYLSDPRYINELCIAIASSSQDEEIHLYLGSAIEDIHTINISAVIHAIQNSKATIFTHAYGYCSIPETMIWTYGAKREIGDYGAIKFGGGEWIRRMSTAFTPYINTYLKHCFDIGILSEEMIEDIIVKQKEYMFIKDINTSEYILI